MKYRPFCAVPVRRATVYGDTLVAFMILALAILAGTSTVSACHTVMEMSTQPEVRPLALSQFVAGIVTRSADLNYITEQDSEVFAFYRNTPVAEMTDSNFLNLLRRPTETQITRQPWSTFFQIRAQSDPTGRWARLQEYLEANLKNPAVFRLPRDEPYDAQYDLYAVGIFNDGTVVGVQMFGVAT